MDMNEKKCLSIRVQSSAGKGGHMQQLVWLLSLSPSRPYYSDGLEWPNGPENHITGYKNLGAD